MLSNEINFLLYVIFLSASSILTLRISKSALISFISLQAVLANLFVSKQITLFGFTATASDALAVGCTLGLNLVQEFYGKIVAQKAVITSFVILVIYTILSVLHLNYIPTSLDSTQSCYLLVLSGMPRIIIASLTAYFISQNLDCWLYSRLQEKFKNRDFVIKNYISVSITQLLDTIIFSFLGLYKLLPQFSELGTIYQIIFISYTIKIITIIISAPVLNIFKKLIKIK